MQLYCSNEISFHVAVFDIFVYRQMGEAAAEDEFKTGMGESLLTTAVSNTWSAVSSHTTCGESTNL